MTCEALTTHAQGQAALERLVAGARTELLLSATSLSSHMPVRAPNLRDKGLENWGQLITHLARSGVRIRILLGAHDPLFSTKAHRITWRNATDLAAMACADTQIQCAAHGQRGSRLWLWRMDRRIQRAQGRQAATDPALLTPTERRMLTDGPDLQSAFLRQTFAVVDRRSAAVSGPRLMMPSGELPPHCITALVDDADFARALEGHFSDCWNDAIDAGNPALTGVADRRDTTRRVQSRADLRLVRTLSKPQTGVFSLLPKPYVSDHIDQIADLVQQARTRIHIETRLLTDRSIIEALVRKAETGEAVQLTLLMPTTPNKPPEEAPHTAWLKSKAIEQLRQAWKDRIAVVAPAFPRKAEEGEPALLGAVAMETAATVIVVDGKAALVGSAHLSARSLRCNSEVSVLLRDPQVARALQTLLDRKWLGRRDPHGTDCANTWRTVASTDATLDPAQRTSHILPYPREALKRQARRYHTLPDAFY